MFILCMSFGLLTQIKYLGVANYNFSDSILYVLYLMPRNLYRIAPFIILLTAVFLIQRFIQTNELLASLCQGVSKSKLLVYLVLFSLIMIAMSMFLGEWVAPSLERSAKELRARAVTGGNLIPGENSFWVKDGRQFIHATWSHKSKKLNDIEVYIFDNEKISKIIHAGSAFYQQGDWVLNRVDNWTLGKGVIRKQVKAEQYWHFTMTPSTLSLARVKPSFLSMKLLYKMYHESNGLVTPVYQHALFKRCFYPLNLMLLSLIIFAILLKNSHDRVSFNQHSLLLCWTMFVFSSEYILQLMVSDVVTPLIWGMSSIVLLIYAMRTVYNLKFC